MAEQRKKVKTCFLGTRLEAFKVLSAYTTIVEIITVKDSYVYNFCIDNQIPVFVVSKENRERCFDHILSIDADLFFSVGFPYILPEPVVSEMGRVYNSHPSLLPDYKGYYAITDAIKNKEKYLGVTVHEMVAELDAGPIVEQEKVFVEDLDLEEIYQLIFGVVEPMTIVKSLDKILTEVRTAQSRPNKRQRSIGGEFELDEFFDQICSDGEEKLTRGNKGTWSANGRSGFYLILKRIADEGFDHIHLPSYLCSSLMQPIVELGLNYSFYHVDMDLVAHPEPPENSAVLLIHYFGKLNEATRELRSNAGNDYCLIEDFSHALLSNWGDFRADSSFGFFSARKVSSAPLGGWSNVIEDLDEYSSELKSIAWKSLAARYLKNEYLGKMKPDEKIERIYLEAFENTERYFDNHSCNQSIIDPFLNFVSGIDWDGIASTRIRNWNYVNDAIQSTEYSLFEQLPEEVVPLGYVISLDPDQRDIVKKHLAKSRIFCPVHWDLPLHVCKNLFSNEYALSKSLLTLPIDQRYDKADLDYMVGVIKEVL